MAQASDVPTGMGPEPIVGIPHSNPEDWFGPFYLTAIIDHLSIGIQCSQVWNYHSSFPRDPVWMKRLVDVALCLSVLKAIQSFYLVWEKSIMQFGDWDGALKLDWAFYASSFIAAMTTFTAQVYFAWRCYALTGRKRYFLILLIFIMLVALALSAGLSAQLISNPHDTHAVELWALPMFVIFIVLDSVITITVSYQLITLQKGDNRNTDSILTKLLAVTWESALPPTLMQFVGIGVQYAKTPRVFLWNYLVGELASRLYIFSLMYSLNSRAEIRKFSQATQPSDPPERRSGIELTEVKFRKEEVDSSLVSTCDSRDPKSAP